MRKMSGDASAVAVSFTRTAPFPFLGEEMAACGANAVIAAAAMCLQIRPSCAMRTRKSGQVQEPLPCGSSFTLYAVPLLLVTMNSGKSPETCRRFDFISSTARAQRFPAFDCSRESARDADCGSTTCAATDMWFSPIVDWWLEWLDVARATPLSRNPAGVDRRGSAAELLVDLGLWVKGFVGKTRWRHLDTQGHQEMLVAEGVKQSDLADRFREQLHRDRVGFEALHILGQVVKIEADVSRLSRDASVLQSDAVCGAVVFGFDGNG